MRYQPADQLTGTFYLTIGQAESSAAHMDVPMLPGKFKDLDALVEYCEQQAQRQPMKRNARLAKSASLPARIRRLNANKRQQMNSNAQLGSAPDLNTFIDNCEKQALHVSK